MSTSGGSACYHFTSSIAQKMRRTALQALSRASLSHPSSRIPCTCAHLASPAPSSTSSIASRSHHSSSLARQRNTRTSLQASNSSDAWRRRWQSTSTSPTTTAAGVKSSYPTSGSAPLQSSPVRRRTVNTSLPQIKVSPSRLCRLCSALNWLTPSN